MSWYKVTFSVSQMADGRHFGLCKDFEALFIAAGAPRSRHVFGRRRDGQRLLLFTRSRGNSYAADHELPRH